ncbi:hypothetical protein Lal_00016762 [Lupinus albus]|nr:hypothetical protein Lal_00016762 [Lupinus albus]
MESQTNCRGIIGLLVYNTSSCPDIQFSDYLCTFVQADPRESQFKDVKRMFKYVIRTTNLSLFYEKTKIFRDRVEGKSTTSRLIFFNVDFARDRVEGKSTTSRCYFLDQT